MVVINWARLIVVSENLSHNFFGLKGEPVWSLTLGDDNMKITEGGTYTVTLDLWGTYAHRRSGGDVKLWKTYNPSCIKRVIVETTSVW